jgi:hypothetical protein
MPEVGSWCLCCYVWVLLCVGAAVCGCCCVWVLLCVGGRAARRSWEVQHIFFFSHIVFPIWEARLSNASWGNAIPPLEEVHWMVQARELEGA